MVGPEVVDCQLGQQCKGCACEGETGENEAVRMNWGRPLRTAEMTEGKQEPTPGSPTPAPCCMWPAGNAGAHGHGAAHPLGPGPGKADRDTVGTGEAACVSAALWQ